MNLKKANLNYRLSGVCIDSGGVGGGVGRLDKSCCGVTVTQVSINAHKI